MKKKLSLIGLAMVALLGLAYYYLAPQKNEDISLEDMDYIDFNLSKEAYIEDYQYAYEKLRASYPYFEINKRVNGIDWLGDKEVHLDLIGACRNDGDFYRAMEKILSDLNNAHTGIVELDQGLSQYLLYRQSPRLDWRYDMAKIYEEPLVRSRYGIGNKEIGAYLEANQVKDPVQGQNKTENLEVEDLVKGDLAYIRIREMGQADQAELDEKVLDSFLPKIRN